MRGWKDRSIFALLCLLALVGFVPLVAVFATLLIKGACGFSLGFRTILNSAAGTGLLVVIALFFAVPVGVLAGIYTSENRGLLSDAVELGVNLLQGVPSIVVGIVVYMWLVKPMRGFSALAGGVALALVMLPCVAKATRESVKLVPGELREAAYSVGAGYSSTLFKVVLPAALGGVLSGILVGMLRAAGETAPLLFTSFGNPYFNLNPLKPVDALPLLIYNYAMSPYEEWHSIAWAASLLLVVVVLALSILLRVVEARWRRY